MKVHCEKCKTKQTETEQFCLNCGTQLGGFANNKLVFIGMGIVALLPPFLFATSKADKFINILNPTIFFVFYLPMLIFGLCIYDYHPTRIGIYFWGGSALISLYFIFYFQLL